MRHKFGYKIKMATLVNLNTQEEVKLQALHTFGRTAGNSDTLLYNIEASRLHAVIIWDGRRWFLKDSSANGSFVNGAFCQSGTKIELNKGDKLHFGSLDSPTWALINVDEPQSMLVPIDRKQGGAIVLKGIVALPSEESLEIALFLSPRGGWVCETQTGISVLEEGDIVETSIGAWRFIDARPNAETVELSALQRSGDMEPEFSFDVSQDEEHVAIKFSYGATLCDLGQRAHHYLLLTLARIRENSKKVIDNPDEQGWVDKEELVRMLKVSEFHVNMQVHRLRKQFIDALPEDTILPPVIERRRGELRFAFSKASIRGGNIVNEG